MIRNVLESIGGIGSYGVVAVCLFFLSFAGTLLWVCLMKKAFLNAMSRLPLEEETSASQPKKRSSTL